MPYYLVNHRDEEFLVRAATRVQAVKYYARENIGVCVADPETIFRLALAGARVLDPELEELDNVEYRAHEERMAKSKKAVPTETGGGPT